MRLSSLATIALSTSAAAAPPAGRPFAAKTALVLHTNEPGRACSTDLTGTGTCSTRTDGFDISLTTLVVLERAATCADLDKRHQPRLAAGERTLNIQIQGTWPFARGTVLSTDVADLRADHADVQFQADRQGLIAHGTIEVLAAAPSRGRLRVKASTIGATSTVDTEIALVFCPPATGP